MDAIQELTKIDYGVLFVTIFTVLAGIKAISGMIEWGITKLGLETKWMRQKREEHELLLCTSQNLTALQKKHQEDVEQSIVHDKRIQDSLSEFMNEMRSSVEQTQKDMKQFGENRIHDREQSFKIQEELIYAIKAVTDGNISRDKQIDALSIANRELLADKIDQKYKRYIKLGGIPEDERDEFISLHDAYKGLGGNHMGEAKFNYVMDHLSIIPVETKLIKDE